MKIRFEKVSSHPKRLQIERNGVLLEGTLGKIGATKVLLEAKICGDKALLCDRCGCEYVERLDQPLKITLSSERVESKDDLDIIEFLDGVIDMEYILQSELCSLEGSFHYCAPCQESNETLEVEF